MRRTILSATLFGAAAVAGMELDRRQSGQGIPLSPDFEFLLGIVGGIGGPSSSAGIISTSAPHGADVLALVVGLVRQQHLADDLAQHLRFVHERFGDAFQLFLRVVFFRIVLVRHGLDDAEFVLIWLVDGDQHPVIVPVVFLSVVFLSVVCISVVFVSVVFLPIVFLFLFSLLLIRDCHLVVFIFAFLLLLLFLPLFFFVFVFFLSNLPPVRLQNPTKLVFNNYDTGFAVINVPFQVGLYGTTDTTIYVHINGLISLFTTTTDNQAHAVPNTAGNIPPVSILPYNADLRIPDINQWGVYFEVRPSTRFTGRELVVEYIVSSNGADYIHFSTTFYEASTGRSRFEYYQSRLKGADASVGIQNLQISPQRSAQWSFMGAFTQDNFFVEYNAPNSVGDSLSTGQVSSPATSC
ncbi:peptidase s8 and s53 subtilisin kexin sedolisin [Colletotrichum musicola]|uniref:Peptidase s8 and s53 subtilisin kexin sedolisin n=1 Tax=Colletotrichum musicola TaxID=2175873 RepID=A0A8H6K3S9_9PEZI|nr:peptidase s8 and s53 subtilisin kexin sedolisin [Colletotrichum musicola]